MQTARPTGDEAATQLQSILESAGISTLDFAAGSREALRLLAAEIEQGGAILARDATGQLVRQVRMIKADVTYRSPEGELLRLIEKRQIFRDGYERNRQIDSSISKLIDSSTNASEAVMLHIRQGLKVEGALRVRSVSTQEVMSESKDYPGLPSLYKSHHFSVLLNDKQFNPHGYVERQDDVETFYEWQQVGPAA